MMRVAPSNRMNLLIYLITAIIVTMILFVAPAYGDEEASAEEVTSSSESATSAADASDEPSAEKGEGEPEEAGKADGGNRVDPTQRADNSFIYDTTIDSLFGQATLYEGDTVQVEGEAIGDLIKAGESDGRELYWVTLTSTDIENKATISVLVTPEQAKQIDHFGRYGVTGTILQVRGIFHQACEEHEGLPDIHATNVSAITRGSEHPDVLRLREFAPGVLAVIIGAVLMGVYYFVRERSR